MQSQKLKFSTKDFFSKFNQIRRKLQIWSHLLKKSVMENLIFLQCVNTFCANDSFCFDPHKENKHCDVKTLLK